MSPPNQPPQKLGPLSDMIQGPTRNGSGLQKRLFRGGGPGPGGPGRLARHEGKHRASPPILDSEGESMIPALNQPAAWLPSAHRATRLAGPTRNAK
jgi:hypothetical protein